MKLSKLNNNQICSLLDRAKSTSISYSWLGSAKVSIQTKDGIYTEDLSALERMAVSAIRNKGICPNWHLTSTTFYQ